MIIIQKKKIITLSICMAILVALIIWTIWANTALELNTYTVTSDQLPIAFDGYRIAHISDLHNTEIGEENETLLTMLREAKPDMIVITGDLIDSRNTNINVALHFAKEAVKIAPCYYVTGNHEARIPKYTKLKEGLAQLNVSVLENERLIIERSGKTITILGVNDPSFDIGYQVRDSAVIMDLKLQALMPEEDGFTVLLSHRPELFDVYTNCGADLVFSGHAHGGQFRLPLIGGLVAPDQGLFPKYDAGLYTRNNTTMVVSRGIGNSIFPFRFNNRPEVILIELKVAQ